MAEKLAVDYAEYLKSDFEEELKPLYKAVDGMITRIEEFEFIFRMHKTQNENPFIFTPKILRYKEELDVLHARINYLHIFINKVNDDMARLEKKVEAAEEHFGVRDAKIKKILKPFFLKAGKDTPSVYGPKVQYERPVLFKTSDYFPDNDNILS